jgi:hypothetical protein
LTLFFQAGVLYALAIKQNPVQVCLEFSVIALGAIHADAIKRAIAFLQLASTDLQFAFLTDRSSHLPFYRSVISLTLTF